MEDEYWSFNVKFNNEPYEWEHFKEFQEFSKNNTSNNYFMAIKLLLDRNKMFEVVCNGKFEGTSRESDKKIL